MDCEFAWQFAWQLWDLRVPDVGQHRTSHLSLSAQRGAGLLAASPPKPQQGVFKGQWQIQFNHICNQYPVESSNSHLNCLTSHLMSSFRGCYAWPNHGLALFCLCAVRHLGQPDSPQWYGDISICSTCHATWNTLLVFILDISRELSDERAIFQWLFFPECNMPIKTNYSYYSYYSS